MKSTAKIPVEIKPVKDPEGKIKIKATIPVSIVLERNFNSKLLVEELAKIEERYINLTTCIKEILTKLKLQKQKRGRVMLYWELGNKIVNFTEDNEIKNLYVYNLINSLMRDTGISNKTISRCKRFRLKFPDPSEIEPERSFDSYIAIFEKGYRTRKKQ